MVQEYESNDLASKRAREGKSAVESKRKDVKGIGINALKKFKFGSDSQLFRGKIPYCFTL